MATNHWGPSVSWLSSCCCWWHLWFSTMEVGESWRYDPDIFSHLNETFRDEYRKKNPKRILSGPFWKILGNGSSIPRPFPSVLPLCSPPQIKECFSKYLYCLLGVSQGPKLKLRCSQNIEIGGFFLEKIQLSQQAHICATFKMFLSKYLVSFPLFLKKKNKP